MEAARLDVLKALGDNTRYAIYLELVRSPRPLATADIAVTLGLHPNTVRPHLERMRDVGLLDITIEQPTGVGRPQHLYTVVADAPSLGLEPPTFPLLARMLVRMAELSGAGAEEAEEAGREQGAFDAGASRRAPSCLEALVARLDSLGFDPAVGEGADDSEAVIAFAHCPFRELAEAHPHIVCSLHRGMVRGFVDSLPDGAVSSFNTLENREPCQMTLSLA